MQIGIDNFKEINEKYGTKTKMRCLILAGILVRQSKRTDIFCI